MICLTIVYTFLRVFGSIIVFGLSHLESSNGSRLGIVCLLLHVAIASYLSINSSSIMTLMFYFSKIVCGEINKLAEQVTLGNVRMNQVSEKILFIKSKMDEMNHRLGIAVLLNFFMGGLTLSMAVCLIAEHMSKRKSFMVSKNLFLFSIFVAHESYSVLNCLGISALGCFSLLEIIVSCKASQKCVDATEKLCQQIEWRIVLSPVALKDQQNIKVVLSMRNKIRFSALDFFVLK